MMLVQHRCKKKTNMTYFSGRFMRVEFRWKPTRIRSDLQVGLNLLRPRAFFSLKTTLLFLYESKELMFRIFWHRSTQIDSYLVLLLVEYSVTFVFVSFSSFFWDWRKTLKEKCRKGKHWSEKGEWHHTFRHFPFRHIPPNRFSTLHVISTSNVCRLDSLNPRL